ncbi:hypothetical protein [Actinophytocola oryzae]|uniref:Putative regulator of Ras-like GTPase activity (Roadblock/LC7/MglB family) n=1 Tax=Actinophytocola oryzae TaxID=502181 RepID=A0A4R7W4I8_9PSEU|nr:hypothetical protein [Actinophytocola oryzae]TDV57504.1 putative regulator of Ras-like GTPase activity (Roadblock/LC7/MglB family) [Actinophytocola oryzae]
MTAEVADMPRNGRMKDMMRPALPAGHRGPPPKEAVAEALRAVHGEDDDILGGMLVAGVDGMVLAAEVNGFQAETHGHQVDMLAVMAAVAAGISGQIAAQAVVGEAAACMIEGTSGHVAVFPLEPAMVLIVFGQTEANTGRFNLAARSVLTRLRATIAEAPNQT